MRDHRVTVPELALIGGTRGMIGMGIGLLIAERLGADRRRAVGLTLLAVGALSTIPLALMIFRDRRRRAANGVEKPHDRESQTMDFAATMAD